MKKYIAPALAFVLLDCTFLPITSLAAQVDSANNSSIGNASNVNRYESDHYLLSQNAQRSYRPYRATSITEVVDADPTDWNFQALQSFIERYGLVRLFSDGTFQSQQPATRFEMIDWVGGALDKFYELAESAEQETGCELVTRPERSVAIPSVVDRNAFYYPSYVTIAEVTGIAVPYRSEGSDPSLDGNGVLLRRDFIQILDRFFAQPTSRSLGLNITSVSSTSFEITQHNTRQKIDQVMFLSHGSLLQGKINQTIDDPHIENPSLLAQITSVNQISDVSSDDSYYPSLQRMVELYGAFIGFPDGTFRADQPVTRGEFISTFNALFDRSLELLAAVSADCNSPSTTDVTGGSQVAVAYQYTFSTALAYSNCLEDIIQLYQDPRSLQTQGRRSDCLPEVFSRYSNGITSAQAYELIAAANNYITNPELNVRIYPPRGQRNRIRDLFGFTYDVDR